LSVGDRLLELARTDERAGTIDRALTAALVGGAMGVLLVGDPTVSEGVHGTYPSITLLPSVIGCYWGGYYLWNFFDAVPRGMRGVTLERAGRVALSDPAMSIFIGALVRLVVAVIVLSGLVIALADVFSGLFGQSDELTVFIAFGAIGTLSMLIGLLESFALQSAALAAACQRPAKDRRPHAGRWRRSTAPGARSRLRGPL